MSAARKTIELVREHNAPHTAYGDGDDGEWAAHKVVAFAITQAVRVFEASDAATITPGDVAKLAKQFEQMFYE